MPDISELTSEMKNNAEENKKYLKKAQDIKKTIIKKASQIDQSKLPVDIAKSLKGLRENMGRKKSIESLMIFVSSSMPRESILNYIKESKEYGGTLVFRGFINNSFKETVKYIQEISKDGARAIVDPRSFRMFNITQVPQIILISEDNECVMGACDKTPIHDRISGNVPLKYALERFVQEGDNKEQAESLLKL